MYQNVACRLDSFTKLVFVDEYLTMATLYQNFGQASEAETVIQNLFGYK